MPLLDGREKHMEKVKRQHYVPRMYLKRFGYGNKDNEKITVLKLDTGDILENQRVENFAAANYFYDTDSTQLKEILQDDLRAFSELCTSEKLLDEQFAEHALGREEAAISDMLNELNKDISKIHVTANKSKMIIFLHSLAYRTKKFRDQMDAINDNTVEFLTAICDNMELDEETKKKTIEVNCSKEKNTQLHQILGVKSVLETMKKLENDYDWYVGINNTEMDFVISDNPAYAVYINFNDICFPISHGKAIILRKKDKTLPIISKDNNTNIMMHLQSRRQ